MALLEKFAFDPTPPTPNVYLELYHHPAIPTYLSGLLSARLGDHVRALDVADELESGGDDGPGSMKPRILAAAVRARVAWLAGRPDQALAALDATRIEAYPGLMPPGPYWIHGYGRHLWPQVLEALGRDREAIGWYAGFPWAADAPERGLLDRVYEAPMNLWRGGIHHRLGEVDDARWHYHRFVELWRDADPALRPLIEVAERRLLDLGEAPP
jgi:hypothetical protein